MNITQGYWWVQRINHDAPVIVYVCNDYSVTFCGNERLYKLDEITLSYKFLERVEYDGYTQ